MRDFVSGATRVVGLVGWSGSGKTTLLARLIPALTARGLRVSTIKHAHHDFDVDQPGKDSHTHRLAGATEVLVSSARRFALMREHRGDPEPRLPDLLRRLSPVDLIVVEGFKREKHAKIEIWRAATGKPPLFPGDPTIAAILSDDPVPGADRPILPLADIASVADTVLASARDLDTTLSLLR